MAFTSSVSGSSVFGDLRLKWGTYSNADATTNGGTITPGISNIVAFGTVPTTNVDETLPKYSVSSGVITLVTAYGSAGNWFAIGHGGG